MRDERELEAEQTVGPPGIYDACRRTINANVAEACNGVEAHTWAAISAILGEREKSSSLPVYPLITIS